MTALALLLTAAFLLTLRYLFRQALADDDDKPRTDETIAVFRSMPRVSDSVAGGMSRNRPSPTPRTTTGRTQR